MEAPIYIVIYAGVQDISDGMRVEYLSSLSQCMKTLLEGEHTKCIVVPRRDTKETWVECINPQLLSEEKFREAEAFLDNAKARIEEVLKG